MNPSLAIRFRPIALQLHGLLRDIDPSRFRRDLEAAMRRRIAELAEAIRRAIREPNTGDEPAVRGVPAEPALRGVPAELASALAELATLLGEHVPNQGLEAEDSSAAWSSFRKQLGQAYEALCQRLLAQSVRVPSLRPTNYTRSVFHALTGVSCIALIELLLSDRARAVVPAMFAGTFWFLETLRRCSQRANQILMWIFRAIAHPRERHQVNSSTWFATALALLGIFFPRAMCTMAIAVVAFADPAASLIGRRYGRIKLAGDRTLVGTSAFVLVATIVAFATLRCWYYPEIAPLRALFVAACASVAAALTELWSQRIDDNFSVPMVAGSVGWLALALSY